MVIVAAALSGSGFLVGWGTLLVLLSAVAGGLIALAITIVRCAAITVPENGFGLISGYRGESQSGAQSLTEWLDDLLNELAGKDGDDSLTFGDLWGGTDPDAERDVNLEMVTTCLTEGRPYRMPFRRSKSEDASEPEFWFRPEEMRGLFPPDVVRQMIRDARGEEPGIQGSRAVARRGEAASRRRRPDEPQLPDPDQRSAAPSDRQVAPRAGVEAHARAVLVLRRRHHQQLPGPLLRLPGPPLADLRDRPAETAGRVGPFGKRVRERLDGQGQPSEGDTWRVGWEGLAPHRRLVAFAGSIFRTMQNWVDQTQSQVHGYRDRVVHIEHSGTEGGMNLKMDSEVITHLSERGGWAGKLLAHRYAELPATEVPRENGEPAEGWQESPLDWSNQRWIRYRSFMGLLEDSLGRLRRGCLEGQPSIEELSRRELDEPPGFPWKTEDQRAFALLATEEVTDLPDAWKGRKESFEPGTPQPPPSLRVGPRI